MSKTVRTVVDGRPFAKIRKDVARAFKPADKAVLIAIESHTRGTRNTAFPSVKTIQKHTGLSQPTIERSLRRLCTNLWYTCVECGHTYTCLKEEDFEFDKKSVSSEFKQVMETKRTLLRTVPCPEASHKEGRADMELLGPAMKRRARTGTSNEYTIFRDDPT